MHNKNTALKLSLYINYFVFACLLNSVGILVQKSQLVYGVTEIQASTLEPFKDLSIAFVSFIIASFLPKLGFKKGLLISLTIVFLACLYMYFGNSFLSIKILFLATGTSFAIVKITVLALISEFTSSNDEHKKQMSILESVFMLGIVFAYLVFPLFNSQTDINAWLNVYLVLALLIFIAFFIVFLSKFEINQYKSDSLKDGFIKMISLLKSKLIIVFALFAFLYVLLEQGIMSWLPTFNSKIISLNETLSVQLAVVFMMSFVIGRFLSAYIIKYIKWYYFLISCLIITLIMVVSILPQTKKITPRSALVNFPIELRFNNKNMKVDNENQMYEILKKDIKININKKKYDGKTRQEVELNENLEFNIVKNKDNPQLDVNINVVNDIEKKKILDEVRENGNKYQYINSFSKKIIKKEKDDFIIESFFQIPLIAFIFPLIGLFLAPLYPLINSTVISASPKNIHSSISGLLVFFSAIGGTIGSMIVGYLFGKMGANAFYFSIAPLILIIIIVIFLKKNIKE